MVRHVYFAFDYADVVAVSQIRKHGAFVSESVAGFGDSSQWEALERRDPSVIKTVIDATLVGTSVTVMCVGPRTASCSWVTYAVQASVARGNGLFGILLPGLAPVPRPAVLGTAPLYRFDARRFPGWIEAACRGAER